LPPEPLGVWGESERPNVFWFFFSVKKERFSPPKGELITESFASFPKKQLTHPLCIASQQSLPSGKISKGF
jgi:hypothetical protein